MNRIEKLKKSYLKEEFILCLDLFLSLVSSLLVVLGVKLLLVDLANHGGAERIIAFISVGALMLLIGWLAPIPPTVRQNGETDRV